MNETADSASSSSPATVALTTKWVDVEEELANLQYLPPTWALWALLVFTISALIPIGLIIKSRFSKSNLPRIHIFQDMDAQPKVKPQNASSLFADGRATRPQVPGSVAWPHSVVPRPQPWAEPVLPADSPELRADDHYYRGVNLTGDGAAWAEVIPSAVPVTTDFMNHGEDRYNVFCAPCHGVNGEGRGPVTVRAERRGEAWTAPANLADTPARDRPVGHLFNTITNGFNNMKGYGHMIPVEDRWAIVAWVRALQRHASTSAEDLARIEPEGESDRLKLEGLKIRRPE